MATFFVTAFVCSNDRRLRVRDSAASFKRIEGLGAFPLSGGRSSHWLVSGKLTITSRRLSSNEYETLGEQ